MARAMAANASGILIKKISRQPNASMSHPPRTGPTAAAIELVADHVPTARPRASPENAEPKIARLLGSRNAAPVPCVAPAANNQGRLAAAAHAADPIPNRLTPKIRILRRPYRSPVAPPNT